LAGLARQDWRAPQPVRFSELSESPVGATQPVGNGVCELHHTSRRTHRIYAVVSLLACALASTDDEGFFTANDVVEPYSAIMKEKKRIAHFEKHLRRFSSDEGGNILIKRGGDRKQTFRFKDPKMQPYVIIRGIQNKKIPATAKALLLQREQGVLPI
jgi:putative component of toxin-antitoxin plasmid stabilization module